MRKITKTLLTLLLAVLMIVGVGTRSINAEGEENTQTMTITGLKEGDRFNVWKIVNIDYTEVDNGLTYTFTGASKKYFDSLNPAVTIDDFRTFDATQLKKAIAGLSKNIQDNKGTIAEGKWETPFGGIKTADQYGTITIENLVAGGYFIEPIASDQIYDLMFVAVVPYVDNSDPANPVYKYESLSVTAKRSDVDVKKVIRLNADGTSFAGSVNMTYASIDSAISKNSAVVRTVIDVPKYDTPVYQTGNGDPITVVKVEETIPAGFTYDAGSIKIIGANSDTDIGSTIDVPDSAITADSSKIEINFSDNNYDLIKSYTYVRIEYTVTAAKDAKLAKYEDGETISNDFDTVYTYSKYPYSSYKDESGVLTNKSKEATAKAYVGGLDINKYGSDSNNSIDRSKKLPNAQFDLYRLADTGEVGTDMMISGTSRKVVKLTTEIKTNANGNYKLPGLAAGTYYLVETVAPTGYKLDNTPNSVVVENGNGTNEGYTTVEIRNSEAVLNLPTTGATGMVVFTISGLAIMAFALLIIANSLRGKKS